MKEKKYSIEKNWLYNFSFLLQQRRKLYRQLFTCRRQVSYSFYEIQRHLLEQLITQFSKQVHPSDKTSFLLVLLMTQRFLLSVVSQLSYQATSCCCQQVRMCAASVRYSQGKLMQLAKCLLNVIYMSNDVRNKHSTILGCTIKYQINIQKQRDVNQYGQSVQCTVKSRVVTRLV